MRVTLSIPDHVNEQLAKISKATGVPKSVIVSRLIEDHYDYWSNGYYSGYQSGPGSFAAPDVKNDDAE